MEARLDELEQLKLRQTEKLETIAAMTQEDARAVLLKNIDDELTHEKAMKISAYQANMKDECDNLARELVGQAIARCAADATSEATVSVVPLPSDEMKGRIIGREVRILVQPDKDSDDEVILLARNVAKKIENELDYPGQIKVSVIRESRATEYAK